MNHSPRLLSIDYMKKISFLTLLFLVASFVTVFAQLKTNILALERQAKASSDLYKAQLEKAYTLAQKYHWDTVMINKGHGISRLVGVDNNNHPLYYTTFDNLIAATTTGANQLWPGGISGLSLSGSPSYLKFKLGIWDGGGVLGTHKELVGRVTQMEGRAVNTDEGSIHATHVAGTMIATGINPSAKGMCFKFPSIQAYLFTNDITSITNAAPNLLLSNHSYGTICGWYMNSSGDWYFEGNYGDSADFKFGYYNSSAAAYDDIAYNAPNYLIVKASGNNRTSTGPAIGGYYYYYDEFGNKVQATRVYGTISNNDSYKTIGTSGNAKNILTVGAVSGITNGYKSASDVIMAPFSSWGPTNDGRIKPDIVADGLNVLSCSAANDSAYTTLSGTSMATPNVTGSLMLLQDYYSQLTSGSFLRSATLKGLAIHTASEAGSYPGPDYRFGWGLLNVAKGAEVIKAAVTSNNAPTSPHLLYENVLNSGQSYSINVVASGKTPITATICWTDPAGVVITTNVLNNNYPELVNDLDIRITKGVTTYYPWKLNPNFPASAATKGDNTLDNVEKIEINNVVPGQVYTITVTHKGKLSRGLQAYSLLVSGVGGNPYCSIPSASSNGASIDKVVFGGINNTKTSGCGAYNDFTNLVATIKPNKSLPISITLSSCGGVSKAKSVNVYIDYNKNGSFADSGELVAKGVVNVGSNSFNATILPPYNITVGTNAVMRVVAVDTINAAILSPCSSSASGETQDYLVYMAKPDNDIAVAGIVSPIAGDNPDSKQLLVAQLVNNGLYSQSNINLIATIKNGTKIIANLSGIYPSPIVGGATVNYTFQQPFELLPNTSYTISVNATATTDDIPFNNSFSQTITTTNPVIATANVCANNTTLNITNPISSTNYLWYNNQSSLAFGSTVSLSNPIQDSVVYISTGLIGNVGPVDKGTYAGGYQTIGNNYLNYTSTVPVILQSTRLYTRYPGKVTIMAADITNATSSGSYYYTVLKSKTIDVFATNPVPYFSSIDGNDAADTGNVFYVNMELPAGKHSIIINATNATLFRSKGLPISNYPYKFSNIFSITGNSASVTTSSDTNFYKSFYYYLYNMKIKTEDCVGDKIPVPVYTSPKPVVTFLNDSLRSSVVNGNQWYHDGVAITGAISNVFKPTISTGNYQTIVTDFNGCQQPSNFLSLSSITPVISANPNRGIFKLSFYVNVSTPLQVSLVNSEGRFIFNKSYSSFQGYFSELFNETGLASGVYVLQVQHGNAVERRKVVIFH